MFGTMICYNGLSSYVIDTYTRYAASASATVGATRSLGGFGFPLFAPYLYQALGYGYGNTVLALAFALLASAIIFIIWQWGKYLRSNSPFLRRIATQ